MTDADRAAWARQLIQDEGTGPVINGRLMPYEDSEGYLTIGFGRNIEQRGISLEEAHYLLMADMNEVLAEMARAFPWSEGLSSGRQRVLASMLFNLGLPKLLKFKKMLAAMEAGDTDGVRREMLGSKWAAQVKNRAVRLAEQWDRSA